MADNCKPHTHVTEQGVLVKCWHQCRNIIFTVPFWIGMTIGYPIEHFIWERVFPFYLITELIKSDNHH